MGDFGNAFQMTPGKPPLAPAKEEEKAQNQIQVIDELRELPY